MHNSLLEQYQDHCHRLVSWVGIEGLSVRWHWVRKYNSLFFAASDDPCEHTFFNYIGILKRFMLFYFFFVLYAKYVVTFFCTGTIKIELRIVIHWCGHFSLQGAIFL